MGIQSMTLPLTIVCTRSVRLTLRAYITQSKFSLSVSFCLITNKTQDASDDIAHDHLPGLSSHQTPPHILDPFNQLGRISRPAGRDNTE